MTERLSAYDRDGLRKQAEKREADKQRKLDTWDDLLAACKAAVYPINVGIAWGGFEGYETGHLEAALDQVNAAIAKARGHDAGGE